MEHKFKKLHLSDYQQNHQVEFTKAELKKLYNALLLDAVTNVEDSSSSKAEQYDQLLTKLHHYFTDA